MSCPMCRSMLNGSVEVTCEECYYLESRVQAVALLRAEVAARDNEIRNLRDLRRHRVENDLRRESLIRDGPSNSLGRHYSIEELEDISVRLASSRRRLNFDTPPSVVEVYGAESESESDTDVPLDDEDVVEVSGCWVCLEHHPKERMVSCPAECKAELCRACFRRHVRKSAYDDVRCVGCRADFNGNYEL